MEVMGAGVGVGSVRGIFAGPEVGGQLTVPHAARPTFFCTRGLLPNSCAPFSPLSVVPRLPTGTDDLPTWRARSGWS